MTIGEGQQEESVNSEIEGEIEQEEDEERYSN